MFAKDWAKKGGLPVLQFQHISTMTKWAVPIFEPGMPPWLLEISGSPWCHETALWGMLCGFVCHLQTSGFPLSNRLQKVFLCLLTLFGLGECDKLCAKASSRFESRRVSPSLRAASLNKTVASPAQAAPSFPGGPKPAKATENRSDIENETWHSLSCDLSCRPSIVIWG